MVATGNKPYYVVNNEGMLIFVIAKYKNSSLKTGIFSKSSSFFPLSKFMFYCCVFQSSVTFEDRRKQNYEKGRMELERRRRELQEKILKEKVRLEIFRSAIVLEPLSRLWILV